MYSFHQIVYWLSVQVPMNLIRVLTDFLPDSRPVLRLRGLLLKPFLKKCGRNFQVASGVQLLNAHNLSVGDDVFIGYHSWINALGEVTIESEVMLGPFVAISSLQHGFRRGSVRFAGETAASVKIGRGSWIGAHACIMSGVQVGSGVIVGAGAVVTKNVKSNIVVGGVPARYIKDREDRQGDIYTRMDVKRRN